MKAIFLLLVNLMQQPVPYSIFTGKSSAWSIYYDSKKEIPIIEIGGIKYGLHDSLLVKKIDNYGNVIYSSNTGMLYYKNNALFYKNSDLKIDTPLHSISYSDKIDARRKNIYSYDAYMIIQKLNASAKTSYRFDWNIESDYISYRDSATKKNNYIPNYLKKYYGSLK